MRFPFRTLAMTPLGLLAGGRGGGGPLWKVVGLGPGPEREFTRSRSNEQANVTSLSYAEVPSGALSDGMRYACVQWIDAHVTGRVLRSEVAELGAISNFLTRPWA